MTDDGDGPLREGRAARGEAAERLLASVALRAEIALRLDGPDLERLLRSIVEATVALFDAEAASIALVEPGGDLRFRVAAGERGADVVGLSVPRGAGLVGFVAATGQPLAVSNVAADPRFDRSAAERTGYVPRSLLAVPLEAGDRVVGVLEVLDRRGADGFDLRDLSLAGVFARQAAVAIEVSRVGRDVSRLVAEALSALASEEDRTVDATRLTEIAQVAVGRVEADATPELWRLVEQLVALRAADPGRLALVADVLEVAVRHLAPPGGSRQGRPVPTDRPRSWRDRTGGVADD